MTEKLNLEQVDFDLIRKVSARTDQNVRVSEEAKTLGVSVEQLTQLRQTPEYKEVIRQRIELRGEERLLRGSKEWYRPVDVTYADYFRCPIAHIREILDDINPLILMDTHLID